MTFRDRASTACKLCRASSASQTVSLQWHNAKIQAGREVASAIWKFQNRRQGRLIGAIRVTLAGLTAVIESMEKVATGGPAMKRMLVMIHTIK
jgi:hypothetical protein